MSTPRLSVALCTHQPRPDFLARTLAALRAQSLPVAQWELLLIDNGSAPPLAPDLAWHPAARVLREETLGLTLARLRAFREARAEIVVLVDDDNVLAPEYLAEALRIADGWPQLGTWGGQTVAEFETPPPEWASPYLWLAIREFKGDRWSNVPFTGDAMPFGAGLCIRRQVAAAYGALVQRDPQRQALDRTGAQLLGCGDTDLVLTSCDLGLGNGVFEALKLVHLIPARRLEEGYLLELVESTTYSSTLLQGLRGPAPRSPSRAQRLLEFYQAWRLPARARRFARARRRGFDRALRQLESLQKTRPDT